MSASQVDKKKRWVLIVDDEPDIINLVRTFIELSFGNEVKFIEAKDGVEATAKLTFQRFDLIITDLKMPKKEGQAFIQSARESQMNNKSPIFVISGYPDYDLLDEHKNIKIFEKPLKTDELIKDIAALFQETRNDDNRLCADLFNAVIKSCEDFYLEAIKKSPEMSDPKARRSREEINGDLIQIFKLKVGSLQNEFVLGFNQNAVTELRKALSIEKSVSDSVLCTKVAKNIVKYAVKNLSNGDKSKVSLIETKLITKDSIDYAKYKKKYGIIIPMKSPEGYEFALQALWERAA